jgi:hypothetical protein
MRGYLVALTVAVGALTGPTNASAATFSGNCSFSGPLTIPRPITIVPVLGAHFSFQGSGACNGKLSGATVASAPLTLTFTDASTLFDTCELGPDFPLRGVMTIGAARFDATVDLLRLALAGPFAITTPGGGLGAGVAQFEPASAAAALTQCVSTGVTQATLAGRFATVTPLVGT